MLLIGCKQQGIALGDRAVQASTSTTSPAQQTPSSPQRNEKDDGATRLIKRYAATYDYDDLFKEEEVKSSLQSLLGREYAHFLENMNVLRNPIDVIEGRLVVYGSRNDVPEREDAILCISLHPLRTHVGIYSGNHVTVYSKEKEFRFLPSPLRHWVRPQGEETIDFESPPQQGESEFGLEYKVVQ